MLKEIFEKIEELNRIKLNLEEMQSDVPITFYRHITGRWSGEVKWSTWKILLDESKSKLCLRSRQGFKVDDKVHQSMEQRVIANQGTKNLLFSKDKKDWVMADNVLNTLAEKKYKDD